MAPDMRGPINFARHQRALAYRPSRFLFDTAVSEAAQAEIQRDG